jgi:hypothetical protein
MFPAPVRHSGRGAVFVEIAGTQGADKPPESVGDSRKELLGEVFPAVEVEKVADRRRVEEGEAESVDRLGEKEQR